MKLLSPILTVLTIAMATGCSNHVRTSDNALTAADVQTMLQDVEGAGASSGGSGNVADALSYKDREGAIVFVAHAPTPKVRVANVVSFRDFGFLGAADPQTLGLNSITDARVIFIDVPSREYALIIGIKAGSDTFSYYAFTGSGGIGNGEFTANLSGNTQITVKSFDIQDGELGGVIQLKLFEGDSYLGKVSTLTGFSL